MCTPEDTDAQRNREAFEAICRRAAELAIPPENKLSDAFLEDLGVHVSPRLLRLFIRHNWDKLAPLAHKIHEGK